MKQENIKACKGCQDRKVGCHSQCEKYKELQEHYAKVRQERIRANDLLYYEKEVMAKRKGYNRWY